MIEGSPQPQPLMPQGWTDGHRVRTAPGLIRADGSGKIPSGPAAQRPSGPAAQRPSGMRCARREAGARRPAPSTSTDSPRRPEPRPGRSRARLFFFPALALLLGALSLFHAAPAEAQNTPPSSDSIIGVHDPTNLVVTAGDQRLELSWTHNFSSAPDGAGHWVQYKTTAATSWTTSTSSLAPTATSHSITSLVNGTAYNVRIFAVARTVGNTLVRGDFVTGSGTPARPPTVSLSVFPTTVAEGGLVTVIATLSATPAAAVTIPITVTLDSAEAGDFSAGTLAGLRAGFAFPAGQKQKVFNLGTTQDTDTQDEKFTVALGTLPTGYVAGDVTSVTVTIEDDETKPTVSALRALPSPAEEGEAFSVAVTLSALPAVAVNIPLTVMLGTAEPEDFDATDLAWLRSNGIPLTTTGHVTQSSDLVTLKTDLDREDETFTVAIDPDGLAELGLAMAPGAATSLEVTIKDLPWIELKINYGDQELLIGPHGRLGEADGSPRWVQASPTMKSVTLTLDWLNAAIASAPTAQVYYYMPGVAGDTLTWDAATEKNTSKTLPLYSPLGTPGYPRLTLSAGNGIDYTIYFQSNGSWKFHNNNLLDRLQMTIPQGP